MCQPRVAAVPIRYPPPTLCNPPDRLVRSANRAPDRTTASSATRDFLRGGEKNGVSVPVSLQEVLESEHLPLVLRRQGLRALSAAQGENPAVARGLEPLGADVGQFLGLLPFLLV